MMVDWRRSLAAKRGWATRRWKGELLAKLDAKANKVKVRPCSECESRRLCEPDCGLAPWNLYPDGEPS